MADTTLTGATTELEVDTKKTETRKTIIKYVLIALAIIGAYILVKKFILK